jgi:hypothetical protein
MGVLWPVFGLGCFNTVTLFNVSDHPLLNILLLPNYFACHVYHIFSCLQGVLLAFFSAPLISPSVFGYRAHCFN